MSTQPSTKDFVRDVVATDGVVWRLREVRDWNRAGKQVKSLLAERAGGFRKVWSYPSDWGELSDLQLGILINDPVTLERANAASPVSDAPLEAPRPTVMPGPSTGADPAAGGE